MQIKMVLSSGMLVNKESTIRLAICNLGSCLQVSSANWSYSVFELQASKVISLKHCFIK